MDEFKDRKSADFSAKGITAPVLEAEVHDVSDTVQPEYAGQTVTKRGLTSRHINLISIAGAIGTGLFVGIGGPLNEGGPLSLLLAYIVYGLSFIWVCNLCVAEMCGYLPVRGSIFELATRFFDPALGFAMFVLPISLFFFSLAL